jgi:pectinesterase
MKRTRDLVLDKWYSAGHDSYHVDKGEGADFFRVGSTLGGGATAIWRDGRLHRAENFAKHRILADGPIRAAFELEFDPWDAGGTQVTETKRIHIDAGQNLYRQESVFRPAAGGPSEITYAVGFTKRRGLVGSMSRTNAWAWLSGWGPVDRTTGGHGDLGTAVMLERSRLVDWKETDDHYVAVATARAGVPVIHYIGAGWTPSGDFDRAEDWWAHLDALAQRLAAPLRVTVGREGTAR